MGEGDTNVERVRQEFKGSSGEITSKSQVTDMSMLKMDDHANAVYLNGNQARAFWGLQARHRAKLRWWNQGQQYRSVENPITGKEESRPILVDYSNMGEIRRLAKSYQINMGGRSRMEHRHLNTPITPMMEGDQPTPWYKKIFAKK